MKHLSVYFRQRNHLFFGILLLVGIFLIGLSCPSAAFADGGVEPTITPTATQIPPTETPTPTSTQDLESQPDAADAQSDQAFAVTPEFIPDPSDAEGESSSLIGQLSRTNQCLIIGIVLVIVVITIMVIYYVINQVRS